MKAKKFRSISLMFCLASAFCFMLSGCIDIPLAGEESISSSEGSSGGGSGGTILSRRIDELNDLKIASLGNGEKTGEYCYLMITHLTDIIYDGINAEYGSIATVERSGDDTHKNAMAQDGWAWVYDDAIMQDVKDYLQYNLSCVLVGKPTLSATPQEFSITGNEYNTLKASGAFSRDENGGLRKLANEFYHTGYYFYEVDKIVDYILKNVIGQEIVQRDAHKFFDKNRNGTFDYVEDYVLEGNPATYNIITGYEFPDAQNREECSKNGVWDRIQWGVSTTAPVVTSDTNTAGKDAKDVIIASDVMSECAYTLAQIENIVTAECTNAGYNAEQTQTELAKYKQVNDNTKYSGFKNYTNTIYFLLYNAMNNFALNVGGEDVVIPDVLTMTHLPNIVEDYVSILNSMYNQEQKKFLVPCKEYKSVLVTANTLARPMSNFYIVMFTDMAIDLQVNVKLRYHFTSDDYREDIGTYAGESHTVEGHIMTLNIPASPNYNQGEIEYAQGNINLTITPESLPKLQEKGFKLTDEDITPLARLGVNRIVLNKYLPYSHFVPSYEEKWWNALEGYTALPNLSHLGSSFTYQNEYADFLEIVFDVRGTYSERVSFGFGFIWL